MSAPEDLSIETFNALPEAAAREALLACCSSGRWAKTMAAGRPYRSVAALNDSADVALADLSTTDLEEAMAGHPRIGEKVTGGHGAWSRAEQGGMSEADADLEAAIAAGNADYERRFGHVYLVCASGKSAEELLSILRSRLSNEPEEEREVVREEFRKINRLRLARLVEEREAS